MSIEKVSKPIRGKFYIKRTNNVIVFGVLEMDERFIGETYKCEQMLEICARLYPMLADTSVLLHGTNKAEYNDKFACYRFSTADIAEKYEEKLRKSLKNWAENWPGWNEPKSEPTTAQLNLSEEDILEV